jgi:hypothetical protein
MKGPSPSSGSEPRKHLSQRLCDSNWYPGTHPGQGAPKLLWNTCQYWLQSKGIEFRVYTTRERPSPKTNKTGGRYRFQLRALNTREPRGDGVRLNHLTGNRRAAVGSSYSPESESRRFGADRWLQLATARLQERRGLSV